MNDDFVKWFEAQHGPRPGWDRLSDEDLANRVIAGEIAKEIILRRDEWDARRESALYAWQAREQAKGG